MSPWLPPELGAVPAVRDEGPDRYDADADAAAQRRPGRPSCPRSADGASLWLSFACGAQRCALTSCSRRLALASNSAAPARNEALATNGVARVILPSVVIACR